MGIPFGACSSSRKKRLFVEVASGHGTPCLSIQLPRRRPVSQPGIEPGLRASRARVRIRHTPRTYCFAVPRRGVEPRLAVPKTAVLSVTLARHEIENRRLADRRFPSIDSYHWLSVRLSYEPACLASAPSRARPLWSKPKYSRALAFFSNSRSVSSSASLSSAGCPSNASAALTRSS